MSTMTSYADDRAVLWSGDCLDLLAAMPESSVDSIVTDPPYGLGFMGKKWDALPPGAEWAEACLRVLKPGGHLLAFGGSRTWHRLAAAIEDGGFEIRDSLAWLYGSGFPKSLNVAKAIASGTGRPEDIRRLEMAENYEPSGRGRVNYDHGSASAMNGSTVAVDLPPEARQWEGWGTALKPAFEPIVVGRKPLAGTVADNVLAHGTGALNIDGCRKAHGSDVDLDRQQRQSADTAGMNGLGQSGYKADHQQALYAPGGRWPANVVLDEDQAAALDHQAPRTGAAAPASGPTLTGKTRGSAAYGARNGIDRDPAFYSDAGGASRFFYVAKAPKSERVVVDGVAHPTVKPLTLMRWLVRLVTPPSGLVLDTFAGSGTTGEAALLEGMRVLLADDPSLDDDYTPLIEARIARAVAQLTPTRSPVGASAATPR